METLKPMPGQETAGAKTRATTESMTNEETYKRIEELEGDIYYMNKRSPFVDFGNDEVARETREASDEIYRLKGLLHQAVVPKTSVETTAETVQGYLTILTPDGVHQVKIVKELDEEGNKKADIFLRRLSGDRPEFMGC